MVGEPGQGGVVLRLHLSLRRLFRCVTSHRYLLNAHLPVARVLSWSILSRFGPTGLYAQLEERVPGRAPGDWDEADRPKALARVATTLAGFHSVRRRWPGSILRPTRTSAVERYMPRLIRRLQRLVPVIGSETTERLTQCLRDRGSVLCSRQSYELIHGRVNDNNFLVDEERAWAIDLATVQYGDAGRDLIHAIHRLCLGDEKQTEEFLSGYFSEVRGLDRKNFDLQRPFYSGEIHITTAARFMRHWAEDSEKEQTREKVTRCVEDAFHHLES
ncbi:MAG: aminoglycoside phosphotransferase family protein [Planctomycetota bacterium]|nr:aminoglycoside phosphotransferase family protein [Planctomycetota bacterium]